MYYIIKKKPVKNTCRDKCKGKICCDYEKKKENYNTDKRLSISRYTTPSNLQAHTKKDNYYYLLKPYTSIRWLPFEPPQA